MEQDISTLSFETLKSINVKIYSKNIDDQIIY